MKRLTRPLPAAQPLWKKKIAYSDGLRFLMHQHSAQLETQRGEPPQGKCVDCKQDVPAHEIAVKCDKCDKSYVCVRCIDKHDHLHSALESIGFTV